MSYKHLSKAGERFVKQSTKTPLNYAGRQLKFEERSLPEFIRPAIPRVSEEERFKSEKEWKFLPGDRVVVTKKGKWRGQIAQIYRHDLETNGYILDDNGPTKLVPIPKEFWQQGQKSHMTNIPVPLRQEDIKLVADIDDPSNSGKVKTVAVKDIVFRGSYFDEDYKKVMPYRCVSGQEELTIPWPKPEKTEDGVLATPAEVAREQTFFLESVVRSPIPGAALVTIRNPHSKYRRGTLTAKDIAKLVAPKMPLTETKLAYIRERKEEKKAEKRKLTEEDKEQIGARIYEHFKQML